MHSQISGNEDLDQPAQLELRRLILIFIARVGDICDFP